MEREKLWKWTFDKKYKAIWPVKKTKRNTLNESFTGTNQSPVDENMQEDFVERDNSVDRGVGQVDQSVDETFSIVDNTFEEEQASQEQASVTFTEPDSVPQTAIKPEDDRSRNNIGTTRAGVTTADQTQTAHQSYINTEVRNSSINDQKLSTNHRPQNSSVDRPAVSTTRASIKDPLPRKSQYE